MEAIPGLQARLEVRPHVRPSPQADSYELAIVDLDEQGLAGVTALRSNGYEGPVVGFYSHVNEDLGERARAAGVETYPRGRFWRELGQILSRER